MVDPSDKIAVVELAAIERGAGEAITLLHGGVVHSGPAWALSIRPLAEAGYRVIAMDRRGFGRSPSGDTDWIPVRLQAEDVAATLDLREVPATHLVGVSYGALVALEVALRQPSRVLSLTLVEPTLFAWLEGDPDYSEWYRRFVDLEAKGLQGAPPEEWLADWLDLIDPAMAQNMQPGTPLWPMVERSLAREAKEESIARYRPDDERLRTLEVPTLIVNGAESEPANQTVGELLADRIPDALHVHVAGAGHSVHAERPGSFNKLLLLFVARHPESR